VLSPLAVQVLRLLHFTQAEVDAVVAAQVDRNAVLVAGAPRRCRWCAGWIRGGRCPGCVGAGGAGPDTGARADARETLRAEARLLVSARLADVVDLVVGSLDDRGLLPEPLGELSRATGRSVADLADALAAVRAAGGPGLGAPSLSAALLAQAHAHAAQGAPALLVPLVGSHLTALAEGRYASVAGQLGVPVEAVHDAVDYLRRHLRLVPLSAASDDVPSGAPPDAVVVDEGGGRLSVHVLGAEDLGLAVDPQLAGLAVCGAEAQWLAAQLADARALLEALDRRAATLHRVVVAAVTAQHAYVLRGPEAHVPLTRADLAQALGLHPSTVSRAVQGAVLALPGGRTEPLAAFFGGSVSPRTRLARMLASPDPPASDAEAAARLAAAGFPLARRTVAKYRHALSRA
jgi:RNA polymerase sigma-54 factor